jgi:hypothetical protein
VELRGGGPGVNVDFARLSFHVPAEVLCANPVCGEVIAKTKAVSSALVVNMSMTCWFIFLLLASQIRFRATEGLAPLTTTRYTAFRLPDIDIDQVAVIRQALYQAIKAVFVCTLFIESQYPAV